jgi:hypothetical protein
MSFLQSVQETSKEPGSSKHKWSPHSQQNQGMQVVSLSFSGESHPTNSAAADQVNEAAIHQTPPDAVGQLIKLTLSSAHLVIAPDETAWAVIDRAGHQEVHQLGSADFKQWLLQREYNETGRPPRAEALSHAVLTLEAEARANGERATIHLRRAELNGRLYLDLCDASWRAVEIDVEGWRVVDQPAVYFLRRRGMLPLPRPERGGEVGELRAFLNVGSDEDFTLIVAWLLAALRPVGPYPVLALAGEPGSAKSKAARLLRSLVDPNLAALRSAPRDEGDLWIAAANSGMLVLDNLSGIPVSLSDALCRIATGGAYSTRQLHSNHEELLIDLARPVLLTTVSHVITQSDLADRALTIELPAIADTDRRDEAALRKAFALARSRIFGALLDALVHGLRHRSNTSPQSLPRLADFALWATACEGAFARQGTVLAALRSNREDAPDGVIDGDAVLMALSRLLDTHDGYWIGRADQLLSALKACVPEGATRTRAWPTNPQTLSNRLTLAQPLLRRHGLTVRKGKSGGMRFIEVRRQ